MNSLTIDAFKEPTRPVRLSFQILLGLATAGAFITLVPILTVLIPAQVTTIDPLNTASSLALVLAFGAIGASIGNPIAGALSDRTTARLGRRRPWLLTGMLGSALGLTMLANSHTIPLLAAAWFLTQFFGNVLIASYNAVMPDYIPVQQRGTTQAIIGVASPLAIVLTDLLFTQVHDLQFAYYPVIGIMALLTILFVFFYHEQQLPKGVLPPFKLRAFLASFWINPRKYPRFGLAWLTWLLFWSAYTLGSGGFFFLYVQNITRYVNLYPGHEVKDGIATIQMLQIAVGVPLMMAAGVLSDRIHRRKVFVITGVGLIGIGLALLTGFSSWAVVLAASLTIGAGFNIFYSLGLAMISQLLPSASSRGKDLGVINIASTIPQIVLPFLGAAVINTLGAANPIGYQILFLTGLFASGLAIALLRLIRE
jgi:MFS family permease